MGPAIRRLVAVVPCALACLLPSPALAAEKVDFQYCDGFKAPGGSDDGLSSPRPNGSYDAPTQDKSVAEANIAACTAALADARLLPAHTLRRVSLQRALALADLQADRADAALAVLDQAEQTAAPLAGEPLYRRSLGLTLRLVRAAAWQVKGDAGRTRALAAEVAAERPYSVSVQSMAALLARAADASTGAAADPAGYLKLLPLMPAARLTQFDADIDSGQFAAAARLYPMLRASRPHPSPPPVTALAAALQGDLLRDLSADLNAAYAFAALGDVARSRAVEADARATLATALAPTTPKRPETPPIVNPLAQPIGQAVDRWTTLIEARRGIAEHRPSDALKALVGTELPVNAMSLDLLVALKAALPPAQAALAPDPAAMATRLEAVRKAARLNVAALGRAMPPPETRLARYGGSAGFLGSLLLMGPDGFKSSTDAATGVTTVEFIGQSTSAPVVEEMTLLRAADLARQQGKPGLLIVDRHDYRRTLTTTYRGMPTSTQPAGYKTDLEVRFVDPAALPADLAGERDRVIDANAVYAALAPIYVTRPASPPRS